MIIVDLACAAGHRRETALESMFSDNPACDCGRATWRRPPSVAIGGAADAGPSREQMPRTWTGVRGGDRETVRHWHDVAARRDALESRHPELAGDRRPVLAHEGLFAGAPLRAGDDIAAAVTDRIAARTNERQKP